MTCSTPMSARWTPAPRACSIAAKMIEDGKLGKIVAERYAKWNEPKNQAMLAGKESLDEIAARVLKPKASSRSRNPAARNISRT